VDHPQRSDGDGVSAPAVGPAGASAQRRSASRLEVVYVTYDGVLEPLGESQVVAYLEGLAPRYGITLVSFEKPRDLADTGRTSAMRERLRRRGVRWIRLRYHKAPSLVATAADLLHGVARTILARRGRVDVVHARGYVPSVLALCLQRLHGARFVFDMRGFWPDEKVQAGHWRHDSRVFRLAKRWERRFFESADAIVSLTHAGVAAFPSLGYRIRAGIPIVVIPTCTDLQRFAPASRDVALARRLGVEGCPVIGTTGTLSNWYLRQESLRAMGGLAARLPRAKVLLVTREDHARLREDAAQAGIPGDRLVLAQADFASMPMYVRMMDLGVFFIAPTSSKRGSAATKLGEFLATGVPVLINDGVGDSGAIVREGQAGVVVSSTGDADLRAALPSVLALLDDPCTAQRCRDTARRHFDLRDGIERYASLYEELAAPDTRWRTTA
jgi:glycosyltransferase involved in cell wall biosynthesis